MVIAASHGHSGTEGPTPAIPAVDREVLESALADLLSYKGDDSPLKLMMPDTSTGGFAVTPDSAEWPLTVDPVLEREATKWQGLSVSESRGLRGAAAHLV